MSNTSTAQILISVSTVDLRPQIFLMLSRAPLTVIVSAGFSVGLVVSVGLKVSTGLVVSAGLVVSDGFIPKFSRTFFRRSAIILLFDSSTDSDSLLVDSTGSDVVVVADVSVFKTVLSSPVSTEALVSAGIAVVTVVV